MNNNPGSGNHPLSGQPAQPTQPQQPAYQGYRYTNYPAYPVSPQSQPVSQPVQNVSPQLEPMYQQPIFAPNTGIPVVKQTPEYITEGRKATATMNKAVFVLLSVLFGWICSRTLFSGRMGIGMTVMGLSFYAFYIPFIMYKQKKTFSLFGWLLFIPQSMILLSFTLFSDIRVRLIAFLASLLIVILQTTLLSNCTTGKPFTYDLFCDSCINYTAMPFMNMTNTLGCIFLGKDRQQGDRKSLKVAIGVAISVPVVFILIMLFAFADEMFARWVRNILDLLNLIPARIVADVLFTVVTMLYVMPLVVTLRSGVKKQYTHEPFRRMLDPIIAATVLFASSVIYLVFVAVQFTYLFAGADSLPDGLSLAEYSRRGFFELVFVIVVTTIIIAAVCVLTKTNQNDSLPVYVKAALLIITASNMIITVSAARRLLIYIANYNMTVSRFNAAVLIALMAVTEIIVALRIIFDGLRVSAVMGSVLAVTAAFYCLFNVDGFVARYNVDMYLSNPTENRLDMDYLAFNMSSASIPQLERVMLEAPDGTTQGNAKYAIAMIADRMDLFEGDNNKLARWTVDRQKAVDILEKYNITYSMADQYYYRYSEF